MLSLMLAVIAADPNVCKKLSDDYDNISKGLALLSAEGATDNSAIRATMREAQETNIRSRGRDTLELMKANQCPIPSYIPNAGLYMVQAMKCKTDQLQAQVNAFPRGTYQTPYSCDIKNWRPEN